jgi:hypothetical protein
VVRGHLGHRQPVAVALLQVQEIIVFHCFDYACNYACCLCVCVCVCVLLFCVCVCVCVCFVVVVVLFFFFLLCCISYAPNISFIF